MYVFELDDLMLFVKYLKAPTDHFNIYQHVHFTKNSTRSGASSKLVHRKPASSTHQYFYFNRIVRLWNHMPTVDLSVSTNLIKTRLTAFLWNRFISTFNSDHLCSHHVICPAIDVLINQLPLTSMSCQTYDLTEQLIFIYN